MKPFRLSTVSQLGLMGGVAGSLLMSVSLLPLSVQAQTYNTPRPGVLQPPLPGTRQAPIAYVQPTSGTVDVQLINRTGSPLNYEAIQYTDYRLLPTNGSYTLQNLPLPTTITLRRTDGGFICFLTQSQPGRLTLYLYPTANFNDDAGALRIQQGGVVYLN